MHFWNGKDWSVSKAESHLVPGVAIADQVQHKARLKQILNVEDAMTLETPEGEFFTSSPLMWAFWNAATGETTRP